MFLTHNAFRTASQNGRLSCIMITKTVCLAGGDQSCVKECSPELVSMQYAWCHGCTDVQKESLRFPEKDVLKNTVASGGAGGAQMLHRLQMLLFYSSTLSQHSM
ncbi:TPA: hypothetical protein ACH3X1_007757 [Trebouxia sp. C0004]